MDIIYFGWNRDTDRVWGAIQLKEYETTGYVYTWNKIGQYLTFWGKRDGRFTTKITDYTRDEVESLIETRRNDKYIRIDKRLIDLVHADMPKKIDRVYVTSLLKI